MVAKYVAAYALMASTAFSGEFCYDQKPRPWCAASTQVKPLDCSKVPLLSPEDFHNGAILQDTAGGSYSECAVSPSGVGGPRSYYKIRVPAGKVARVSAASVAPEMTVLMRALENCDDTVAYASNISSTGPDRGTVMCFQNASASDKDLIIAISRYSGEEFCRQIMYRIHLAIETGVSECSGGPLKVIR
ncbi:MAG: hypothetical protein NTV34_06350 [Proteobacteria bacterium]|nr:hypothetical protein [Pseudomonadota bacterium]